MERIQKLPSNPALPPCKLWRPISPKITALLLCLASECLLFQALLRGLIIKEDLAALATKSDKTLLDELVQHFTRTRLPLHLERAVTEYRTNVTAYRRIHKLAVLRLGLNHNATAAWVEALPTVELDRLPAAAPYPLLGHHINEDPRISSHWRQHIYEDPLTDKRKKRRPLHEVQEAALQHIIGPSTSCKIVDRADQSIVAIVICGAMLGAGSADPRDAEESAQLATSAVCNGIPGCKSIRVRTAHFWIGLILWLLHCSWRTPASSSKQGTQQGCTQSRRLPGSATC